MGFASVRKPRLTAITGDIWFTLLLSTGIQGKLATQTPSKHPGHKPRAIPTRNGLDVGVIILAAMCVRTLCVTFLAGMHVHLVLTLPVSSEASGS